MPINTTQITQLTSKKTFNQMKDKVNELINVVNGLPSTVTGAITRLGGVIDGQTSGAILDFPSGSLFVIGAGGIGVGDFLNTSQPSTVSGKLHLHSASTDALMYISQNTASKVSGIGFQTGNSATSVVKNSSFLGSVSNTSTQSTIVTLLTANLNHSIAYSSVFSDQSTWGTPTDILGISRLTLISGDIKGISPHGGPSAHLNVPLRIERAITYDNASSNSSPHLSVIGYVGTSGSGNVPVRFVIGDKEDNATKNLSLPFAVFDFIGDGADEQNVDSIKARISSEYDSLNGTNGSLRFAVRNNTGSLISSLKIAGGSTLADAGKIIVSNNTVLSAFSKEGVTSIADKNGQLIIKQHNDANKDYTHMGVFIQGSETNQNNEHVPYFRLENILSQPETSGAGWTASTRKWSLKANGNSTHPGSFVVSSYPDLGTGWSGANSQFQIIPGGSKDQFIFGNRTGLPGQGKSATNGAVLIVSGGSDSNLLGGSVILDTAQISNIDPETPNFWAFETENDKLVIAPRGMGTADYINSQIAFSKPNTSNTNIGIGTKTPSATLHLTRSNEWANVVIESAQSTNNGKGAQFKVQDASGSNNYVILNSIPDISYPSGGFDRGKESPISIIAARTESSGTSIIEDNEAARFYRKIHSFESVPTPNSPSMSQYIGFRNQVSNSIYSNTGDTYDGVRIYSRTKRLTNISYGDPSPRDGASFEIWTAKSKQPGLAFSVSSAGYIGAGRSTLTGNPIFNIDVIDDSTNSNTYIGLTRSNQSTNYKTWVIGNPSHTDLGAGAIVTGENPLIISPIGDRNLGAQSTLGGTNNLLKIDRIDSSIQRIFLGAPTLEGVAGGFTALSIYTWANTTSTNWSGGASPRVGIANSYPAYTFVVGSDAFAYNGMASVGLNPIYRLYEIRAGGFTPTPTAAGTDSRFLSGADPGMKTSYKTWTIGSEKGQMFIGQGNLSRVDNTGTVSANPYDTSVRVVNFFANNNLSNTVTTTTNPQVGFINGSASISRRYGGFAGITDQEYGDFGSVSINGPSYPLSRGLFVADTNRKTEILSRKHFATYAPHWNILNTDSLQVHYGGQIRPVPGLYPTFVALSGSPLHTSNGAHTVVSIHAATTANGIGTLSTANTFKRVEAIRRYKELPSTDTIKAWNTTSWHDYISIDNLYNIPMPNIGGSDNVFGLSAEPEVDFYKNQSTKVWWERRPHPGGTEAGSTTTAEYSESHLFGSSNNHVMTIHANSTFQGVHVEKGGLYANNGILAWARILPRGGYSMQHLTTGTDGAPSPGSDGGSQNDSRSGPSPVTVIDSHNIATVQEFNTGNFMVTFGARKPIGNNYTVSICGTNNLFITAGSTKRKINMESASDNDVEASQSFHSIRVANNTHIAFQTKAMESDNDGRVDFFNIDEDEIYLVVIGAPNPAHWRG